MPTYWIGILVIVFSIGRAVQRWCDDAPDLERRIYEMGYEKGVKDGRDTL